MKLKSWCILVTASVVTAGCGLMDFTVSGEAHSTIPADCTIGGQLECLEDTPVDK
jgi:hypothetical protein